MTKTYSIILIVFSSFCAAIAQNAATPNPGFENWTQVGNHYDPDNWNTLNPNTSILGVFTCTRASGVDVHSGNYAIKLTTKSVFGVTANGIASTATLVTTPPYGVTGGIPYTGRPDSITGWFKCNPASTADSGFAQLVLLDANNDTVGFCRYTFPNTAVSSYTRFSKAVTYFSSATPALSYWILSSSDGANPVVNSNIFIDDIDFVFNTTSISELKSAEKIYLSNPVHNNILKIKNETNEDYLLQICEATGRIMATFSIVKGENNLNVEQLPNGIYVYRLYNYLTQFVSGKVIKISN